MDIQHCAERICEHRFGAAKIGDWLQKQKDVQEEILAVFSVDITAQTVDSKSKILKMLF